jgi:hypothetical protein
MDAVSRLQLEPTGTESTTTIDRTGNAWPPGPGGDGILTRHLTTVVNSCKVKLTLGSGSQPCFLVGMG